MEKTEATFFKEEVEASIARYGNMSTYETIGALEVVKANLLERLGQVGPECEHPPHDDYLTEGTDV